MRHILSFLTISFLSVVGIAATAGIGVGASPMTQPKLAELTGKLPLAFEANRGQTNSQVDFLTRGRGFNLFLTEGGVALVSHDSAADEAQRGNSVSDTGKQRALFMKLIGSRHSQVAGLNELPGKSNYFVGQDPKNWHTNLSNYAKVRYQGVYPGIDLIYYGTERQLEYDWVVSPGARPEKIQVEVQGADRLELRSGNLVIHTAAGEVSLAKPVIYQEADSRRQEVSGTFVLTGRRQFGFQLGKYDAAKPLVIDPVLTYSTLLGGTGSDSGSAIAVDSSGNTYVTGYTASTNFPVASGALQNLLSGTGSRDAFVTELNPAGTAVVFSTFLGGSSDDQANAIAVDSTGSIYLTGVTASSNFPVSVVPAQPVFAGPTDAFVTKLNAGGASIVFSTFLGGTDPDVGMGIAVDPSYNAYITGRTDSLNYPTTVGAYQRLFGGVTDAFVTELGPTGNIIYSTFLGGEDVDQGLAIAVDSSSQAYITGSTASQSFPLFNPLRSGNTGGTDVFIAKFNSTGTALIYSTYFGGQGSDQGNAIAVDSSQNAYVAGFTNSPDFPTVSALQASRVGNFANAFVSKINQAGSAFTYSTYLGGTGGSAASGIAVNSTGDIFVVGNAGSGFPTANPFQAAPGGSSSNAFISKISLAGSLSYSTYLGGTSSDQANGIAIDSSNNAYVVGTAQSTNFPTTAGAFQSAYKGGGSDAFVVKIADIIGVPNPVPTVASISPTTASAGGAGFALTIVGSNFNAASSVSWNGSARATQLNSPSQLTATILATDIANTGTAQVTVINPAPGGGTSNAVAFTITNPAPPNPTILPNGIVNGASFAARRPVAPGSIATAFGTNMSSAGATTSVFVNGISAPVFAAVPGQINFQVPVELNGQSSANVIVTVGNISSASTPFALAANAPGIFVAGGSGSTQGAVLISNSATVPAPVGTFTGSRPANRGEFITVYCTGLGTVTNQPATGVRASGSPLSVTTSPVSATIGGLSATVSFAGLSPNFFGLYQVDMQVPQGLAASDAVPLVINIAGVASNVVTIAVQ